ncbi:hypothetical protein ACJX0J_023034, partial [Zea mays]
AAKNMELVDLHVMHLLSLDGFFFWPGSNVGPGSVWFWQHVVFSQRTSIFFMLTYSFFPLVVFKKSKKNLLNYVSFMFHLTT